MGNDKCFFSVRLPYARADNFHESEKIYDLSSCEQNYDSWNNFGNKASILWSDH